jgi:hypothetical protein
LTQAIQSLRSKLITRRTYNRPLDEKGTVFETFEQTIDRVIDHQAWLWSRAAKRDNMSPEQKHEFKKKMWTELHELKQLMMERKVLMSGRTLWLGGTDVAKQREALNSIVHSPMWKLSMTS